MGPNDVLLTWKEVVLGSDDEDWVSLLTETVNVVVTVKFEEALVLLMTGGFVHRGGGGGGVLLEGVTSWINDGLLLSARLSKIRKYE